MLQINGNFYGNYGTNGNFDQNDKNTTFITNDNLNARVDAQVYFKVKADEESVKGSIYNVNNYRWQIVNAEKLMQNFTVLS